MLPAVLSVTVAVKVWVVPASSAVGVQVKVLVVESNVMPSGNVVPGVTVIVSPPGALVCTVYV